MSNNYHTPIDPIANVDAATVNSPLGSLDAQITANAGTVSTLNTNFTNLRNGDLDMVQLKFGTESALTIASGAITISRSKHSIDTEGGAASDDLTTINGGQDGDILILRIVNNNRRVVVKHFAVNIILAAGADFVMDKLSQYLLLIYNGNSGAWVQNYSIIALHEQGKLDNASSLKSGSGFVVPEGTVITGQGASSEQPLLAYMPRPAERKSFYINCHIGVENAVGIPAPTVNGTGSIQNFAETTYNRYQSGGSSGNNGGLITTSFSLFYQALNPFFSAYIRTHTSIASCRIWVGLVSAGIGNIDDLGGAGIYAAVFRYSTVAGDTEWQAICSDGSAQDVNATGVTVGTSTAYKLTIRYLPWSGHYLFGINDTSETIVAANQPGDFVAMGGLICRIETREAVAKSLLISRLYCDFD